MQFGSNQPALGPKKEGLGLGLKNETQALVALGIIGIGLVMLIIAILKM